MSALRQIWCFIARGFVRMISTSVAVSCGNERPRALPAAQGERP